MYGEILNFVEGGGLENPFRVSVANVYTYILSPT